MPALDMTTMSGIQVIPWKIALHSDKIQDLINLGKLKLKESNEPAGVEDLFRAKTEMTRQEEKTPRD